MPSCAIVFCNALKKHNSQLLGYAFFFFSVNTTNSITIYQVINQENQLIWTQTQLLETWGPRYISSYLNVRWKETNFKETSLLRLLNVLKAGWWWNWVEGGVSFCKLPFSINDPEGWGGEGGGRGFRMGNTCTPVADSCQWWQKPLQYCKVISLQLK